MKHLPFPAPQVGREWKKKNFHYPLGSKRNKCAAQQQSSKEVSVISYLKKGRSWSLKNSSVNWRWSVSLDKKWSFPAASISFSPSKSFS